MKKSFLHLIGLAAALNLAAQTKMYVQKTDGTVVAFDVDDVSEVFFTDSDANAKTYEVNGVSFKMIKVEAGTFTMGMLDGDALADSSREIQHEVTLTKDFYLAQTECTQELWTAIMGDNPSRYQGMTRPVENVEWEEAKTFIKKLNNLTGEQFRLPTEAEWEYAAKGGSKSHGYIYAGSNSIDDVAWYADNMPDKDDPDFGTHPVGKKKPNELGLYDMCGNVWEWCEDHFTLYTNVPQTDPLMVDEPNYLHVFKGGEWDFMDYYCRSSYHDLPGNVFYEIGFRLCLTIEK